MARHTSWSVENISDIALALIISAPTPHDARGIVRLCVALGAVDSRMLEAEQALTWPVELITSE